MLHSITKEQRITKAIDEMLEKCNDAFTSTLNDEMRFTIAQKGRAFTHPSHNVMGGAQKTKTTFNCSICKLPGHTAPNCPNK